MLNKWQHFNDKIIIKSLNKYTDDLNIKNSVFFKLELLIGILEMMWKY